MLGIALVLVVVIALVFVGDAVGKTTAMPDQIVLDVHEAINFCAEALPSDVTAMLTFDELRRLLRLHLEWIQAYHWAPEGSADGPILFEEFDALDYVMERCAAVRLDVPANACRAGDRRPLVISPGDGCHSHRRPGTGRGRPRGTAVDR